jgi:GNAT superfamily N-acetyltransferase
MWKENGEPGCQQCLIDAGLPIEDIFYFGESVLRPEFRGKGIGHRFFDLREKHARSLGATVTAFCAVDRPADHPARPADYRPLDAFWRRRGYVHHPEWVARIRWREIGQAAETEKTLSYRVKRWQ